MLPVSEKQVGEDYQVYLGLALKTHRGLEDIF